MGGEEVMKRSMQLKFIFWIKRKLQQRASGLKLHSWVSWEGS